MTEFEVGQKIYGEEYDQLPVGAKFRLESLNGSSSFEWEVVGHKRFQSADRQYDWSVYDYEYTRTITYLPEPVGTLYIKHTLMGAKVGDKVWPVNMPPSPSKWPATIQGLDVDLVNVITADGHLERIHPSSLTTTPVEPPVWSVVTTTDEFGNERSHHRNEYTWHSSDRITRTWPEVCDVDANGAPLLKEAE